MQISKNCEIFLNGNIEEVFPLFGFWEEKKWAYGWNPKLVHPKFPKMNKGTIFQTNSEFKDEEAYNWIVSHYDPQNYIAEYTNSTQNRIWVIRVECKKLKNTTKAKVTYTYTALNEKGAAYNKIAMRNIFENDLKDWEEAINYYLKNRKQLKP